MAARDTRLGGFLGRAAQALTLPPTRQPAETRDSVTLAATARAQRLGGGGGGGEILFGGDTQQIKNTKDFLDAYADRPWVYACVNRKAKSMKQAPLVVEPMVGDGDAYDEHPLLDLFRSPNPMTTGGLFKEQMQADLDLTGDFYAEIVYGKAASSYPLEMYRMNPSMVEIVIDKTTGLILGYLFNPGRGASKVFLEPQNVWHRRYANPQDDYRGMSPLSAARDSVVFEYQAKATTISYFANGMRISGIISGAEGVSDDDMRLVRRSVEGRHRGAANSNKVAVLPGQWTYTDMAGNPKDADWIAGLAMSRREVCAVYRVAPPLAGDFSEGTTFSNLAEARDEFWQGTMTEHYDNLDEDINHALLPLFGTFGIGVRARHDLSQVAAMVDDRDKAFKRAESAYNAGLITLSEAREETGAELEELTNGDTRRLPINVQEIPADAGAEDLTIEPTTPAVIDPATQQSEPTLDQLRSMIVQAEQGTGRELVVVSDGIVNRAVSYPEARKMRTTPIIKKSQAAITKTMAAQRDSLIAWIENHGHSTTPGDGPTPGPADVPGLVESYQWGPAQQQFEQTTRGTHILAAEQAWEHASELGLGVSFKINDPRVVERLKSLNNRANGIKTIVGAQRQAVLDEVARGMSAGASLHQIINGGSVDQGPDVDPVELVGIRGTYDPWAVRGRAWMAERVARTETGMAYNLSNIDAYREGGISKVNVYDGDYDEECAAADGQVWTMDEADANPLEHPNCVRAFGPVTD